MDSFRRSHPGSRIDFPQARISTRIEPRHEKTCLVPFANNKRAGQPAHPRSLISAFVVRFLDSVIPLLTIAEISRLYLVSGAEQANEKNKIRAIYWYHEIPTRHLVSSCRSQTRLHIS